MSDFDYSGYGLFESLASDQQEERRAKRKALVTAKARVEDNLGRFFAASRSGEEFDERYSLVQQEFVATVREAANEFGVDAEPIANSLFAHYRTAAYTKEAPGKQHLPGASDKRNRQYEHIKDSYEDEGTSEDEAKELAARTVNKERSEKGETKEGATEAPSPVPLARTADYDDHGPADSDEGDSESDHVWSDLQRSESEEDDDQAHYRRAAPNQNECACGRPFNDGHNERHSSTHLADSEKGICSECDKEGWLKGGICGPCRGKRLQQDKETEQSSGGDNASFHAKVAGEETCPRCGGSGHKGSGDEYDDEGDCPTCKGTGKVNSHESSMRWAAKPEEGDSSDKETVDIPPNSSDSPTGLDGPSPKMDKSPARKDGDQGNGLDPIDVPSKQHPTERIDIMKVMPRENVKNSVKEDVKGIGEQTTESQDLPSGDLMDGGGFNKDKNTGDSGPTTTWHTNQGAEPVGSGAVVARVRWAPRLAFYPGGYGNSAEELAYLDSEQPINYDDGSIEGDHYHGRHYDQPHPDCPECNAQPGNWRNEYGDPYDREPEPVHRSVDPYARTQDVPVKPYQSPYDNDDIPF